MPSVGHLCLYLQLAAHHSPQPPQRLAHPHPRTARHTMSSSSSSTNSATPLSTAPPNFFSNLDIVKCLITKLFLTTGLR